MIDTLNSDCFCVSLDKDALRGALEADPAARGLHGMIEERCPHLFASLPVFVSRQHVDEMAGVIRAVEEVLALPTYREATLAWAPDIARHDPGAAGAFIGYDFHLGADGPVPAEDLERTLFDMFAAEWRRSGGAGLPKRVAIVNDAPERQFMYPEFLLFAQLFRRFGIEAEVRAPEQLVFEGGALRDAQGSVDLVYNSLTDFAFEAVEHAPLRAAYLAGAASRCGTSGAACFSNRRQAMAAGRHTAATSSRDGCGARSSPEPMSHRSWCRQANGRSGRRRA